jgi:alkylation response protein AidB-like acyl-CoA dehydrogenase
MDVLEPACQLDDKLGDPRNSDLLFSFAQRVAEDEREHYPAEALSFLLQYGLHHLDVPTALGGKFHRLDQVGALLRVVARRDLTVAIAHAISFLGTAIVWIGGNDAQRHSFAKSVLDGERVSVALTEVESGSDLLNMMTNAEPVKNGYRLKGEKWLGNGFCCNRFILVYARTSDSGGPRDFSLFLFDKASKPEGFKTSSKIATLGVRGADVSGIRFDAILPNDARIGTEGSGFETVLKALQLTRTICGELSLGALETSLETVLRFATKRKVYGKTVIELPQSQKLLSETWAELLIADSLTGLVMRSMQIIPEQASVHSAVVKFFVPTMVEQAMTRLAMVYGARYYLRNNYEDGIFQKMYRDNLLISLFDGSTQVNLYSLSQQLRSVIAHTKQVDPPKWANRNLNLEEFNWNGLSLSAGGRSALFAGFDAGVGYLRGWLKGNTEKNVRNWIINQLNYLGIAKEKIVEDIKELSTMQQTLGDPKAFELSRRYCVLTAAASVLTDWWYNRDMLADTLSNPAVLALVLERISVKLGNTELIPSQCYKDTFSALLARRKRDGYSGLYRLGVVTQKTI